MQTNKPYYLDIRVWVVVTFISFWTLIGIMATTLSWGLLTPIAFTGSSFVALLIIHLTRSNF